MISIGTVSEYRAPFDVPHHDMMQDTRIPTYGPTRSSTIAWEKRNNVNAREYGYYVKDGV